MKSYHHLAWPFYLTGIVIIAFPALEYILTVSPLSPGIVSWRYGAVGLLARSIMTPMVGLVVIFGTAALLGHRGVQRGVMVLGFLGSALLVLTMVMFGLDLLEFRNQVRPGAKTAFDASSAVVLMKLAAGTIVLLAFGLSAWRMARRSTAGEPHHAAPAPLVTRMGQRDEATPAP